MACMYPRHFPDIPIFWDDPSWASENENYREAERILEKGCDSSDDSMETAITDDGPEMLCQLQAHQNWPSLNPAIVSALEGTNNDNEVNDVDITNDEGTSSTNN